MRDNYDPEYSSKELLDITDEIDGSTVTVEQATGDYIDTLGKYITGEKDEYSLDTRIEYLVGALEKTYSALDSFDEIMKNESMVAHVKKEDKKGVCDIEENISRASNGALTQVESFKDARLMIEYLNQNGIEADKDYLNRKGIQAGSPTRLLAEKDRIIDISKRLDREYQRIIAGELLAREQMETDDPMTVYNPEPPIFRMLGEQDHAERVNHLNREFKKFSSLPR